MSQTLFKPFANINSFTSHNNNYYSQFTVKEIEAQKD